LVGASYALPLLSDLYVRDAARNWRAEPARAFASLDRARRLNPLDDRPDLVAGAIASRLDRPQQMRARFAAAVERNPSSWYGFLELGIAEALTGRPARALADLGAAKRLNPREVVIQDVIEKVRAREPVDPDEVDAVFLGRLRGSPPAAGTVSKP
jgi:tetratricopeptide (TPR) repeat protein